MYGLEAGLEWRRKPEKLVVVGHRGKGMNELTSPDPRFQEVKENSLRSFCEAALFPVDLIEFDVQVHNALSTCCLNVDRP